MSELTDGDSSWIGVDGRRDPGELEPGLCSAAINTRFDDGVPRPRKGIRKLPWLANPNTLNPALLYPFQSLLGVGRYNDPNGEDCLLLAGTDYNGTVGVWVARANGALVVVPGPTGGLTGVVDVHFEQCFGGVMMFRGESLAPLYMKSLGAGFESVVPEANTVTGATSENPADGTAAIPPAKRGLWIANRLVIPHARDLVTLSDYLNPTRYLAIRAQGRINQGSADEIVAIAKFNDQSVVVFKEQSIYVIGSATGDLSGMVLDELTREYGCNAPKSIVNVGGDVWFLSNQRGITSITQTAQGILQGTNVPISLPIQNLIDRINWQYAHKCSAAMVDNRVYFAVPLDDARVVKRNLIESATYSAGGAYTRLSLVAGRRYQWVKGASDTNCVNGTETLTASGDFVAQGTSVVLNGTVSVAITAELRPVFLGVNNAVLVYDFKARRWCGYDQSQALIVRDLVLFTIGGRERVLIFGEDGSLGLYEDGQLDEVNYSEDKPGWALWINVEPGFGDNFRLNSALGGTAVTGDGASGTNTTTTWGSNTLANALTNFWLASGTGGFNPANAARWTAPSTYIERRTADEWDIFDTRGNEPASFVTLSGALTTQNDPADPLNSVSRVFREAITHSFTTRGYRCQTDAPKRFRQMQAQLHTWNPSLTITEIRDGVEEEHELLTSWTRDRTKYYRPFTKADFTTTNVNADYAAPQRQDYSLSFGATDSIYATGGLCLDREQAVSTRFRLRGAGRYVRLKFEGAQGIVAVAAVQVLAEPGGSRGGVMS